MSGVGGSGSAAAGGNVTGIRAGGCREVRPILLFSTVILLCARSAELCARTRFLPSCILTTTQYNAGPSLKLADPVLSVCIGG